MRKGAYWGPLIVNEIKYKKYMEIVLLKLGKFFWNSMRLWSKSRILESLPFQYFWVRELWLGGCNNIEVKDIELRNSRSCKLVYCKDHPKNALFSLMELGNKIVSLIPRSSKEEKNHQEIYGWLCWGRWKETSSNGKNLKGRPQTGGWKQAEHDYPTRPIHGPWTPR